jgi:hypothetical protein
MKLSKRTQDEILDRYLSGQLDGPAIGRLYGVCDNYAPQLARRRGHVSPTKRREAWGWRRARMAGLINGEQA